MRKLFLKWFLAGASFCVAPKSEINLKGFPEKLGFALGLPIWLSEEDFTEISEVVFHPDIEILREFERQHGQLGDPAGY